MLMIRARALFSTMWFVGHATRVIKEGTSEEYTVLICQPENKPPYEVIIDPKTIEYFGD
jgi:hypothetical protein